MSGGFKVDRQEQSIPSEDCPDPGTLNRIREEKITFKLDRILKKNGRKKYVKKKTLKESTRRISEEEVTEYIQILSKKAEEYDK